MEQVVRKYQGISRPLSAVDIQRYPELQTLKHAWRACASTDLDAIDSTPFAPFLNDLVVLESLNDGTFKYLWYGQGVSGGSGIDMRGRTTADFDTDIGRFFAETYHTALRECHPLYAANKAAMSHHTHSWQRVIFPFPGEPGRVVALVRAIATVESVLTDFSQDTGFLGGTMEPIVESDAVVDFALLTLTDPKDLLGHTIVDLSDLYGRPLTSEESAKILQATDGVVAVDEELPNSMERFGRQYVLKIVGAVRQPVFLLADSTDVLNARNEADEKRQAMEDFAQTASDWMWESDADHIMTMLSGVVETHTGHPPSYYVGKSRFAFAHSSDNAEVFAKHRLEIDARQPFRDLIYKLKGADGKDRWLRVNGNPRFDIDGQFLGYRGTGTNITDEVEARNYAKRREQELAEAHRIGRLGAWSFNHQSKMVTLSSEYLELVGLSEERAVMPLDQALECFSAESREAVYRSLRKVLRSKQADSVDVVWVAGRSKAMDLNVIAKARQDAQGRVYEIFGTVQDITDRKRAERALEALAFHDPLTGLGNRSFFSRELDGALQRAKLSESNVGLLLLDLDHFKEVNDSLGHAAGDELLRRVSERLSLSVNGTGSVFRLGGDEFAVIVPKASSADDLAVAARSIISAFAGTVKLAEGAVHISTSIGMVMLPAQTSDPEEGMRFADLALYKAKAEGRNRALLFHVELDEEVQDRVSLARDLRTAIKSNTLDAHYQLQVDVMHGKILGFEALARWNHPTRGPIPPAKFIPIAESSRLIADLGLLMVRAVCQQGRAWLDAGGAPLEMAVNLSVAQLWHRDVESDIANALDASGFPPELLCVELTESVFSDEALPRIQRLFGTLKKLGVKIALDDFGTGYSSLSYLNDLSFDKVKIDRAFVRNCDQNSEKQRLLQGIIGLAKGLGLGIIVEGVETRAELDVLSDLGCECVQGFFFSKPKAFHEACLDAAQIEAQFGFCPVLWKDRTQAGGVKSSIVSAPVIERSYRELASSQDQLRRA